MTSNEYYEEKYQQGYLKYHNLGTYDSSGGVPVKHSTREEFLELLQLFSCKWTQEIDFRTINNNPIRALHGIFQLKEKNKK